MVKSSWLLFITFCIAYGLSGIVFDETEATVDEIFSKQIHLGSQMECNFFKEIFITEVKRVHATYKQDIVFRLKGKMTFKQIQQVVLSFFPFNQ